MIDRSNESGSSPKPRAVSHSNSPRLFDASRATTYGSARDSVKGMCLDDKVSKLNQVQRNVKDALANLTTAISGKNAAIANQQYTQPLDG